ncbi:MAG TPA: hypothetical protein VFK02_32020 [Kofleriaceae bacterium]|nr:hypothetical protein [Kofleriaceae bacterium]
MTFDVAVGVTGAQLNVASQALYQALYPRVFTGSQQVTYQGLSFTVEFDVQAAPQFDLSGAATTKPADTAALLGAELAAQRPSVGEPPEDVHALLAAVAPALPTFSVQLPGVAMKLSSGTTTSLTLPLTVQCGIANSGSTISFLPYAVTAPQQSDPVTNYLVQSIVLPAVKGMMQQLLAGITIPPISVPGVALSAPSLGIVQGAVIAAVNLASSGTPPPPDGSITWPTTPFFTLLGPRVIQQLVVNAMASTTNRFSDSGSGGDFWGGYRWSYGLSLTSPQTSIQGTSIAMSFTLQGGVSAGVHVTWLSVDLGFDAYARPNPSLVAGASIRGGQLVLTTQSVAPFTIFVVPNSVPSWVLGWIIAAIINAVVTSLTPLVTVFLKDIDIESFSIPTYSVAVGDTRLTLTPSDLSIQNVAEMLALTGTATISQG